MSGLDSILALLRGRKVLDEATNAWRVFDAGGAELADPGGVLWRGAHGMLLQAAMCCCRSGEDGGAGVQQGGGYGQRRARTIMEAEWDNAYHRAVAYLNRYERANPLAEETHPAVGTEAATPSALDWRSDTLPDLPRLVHDEFQRRLAALEAAKHGAAAMLREAMQEEEDRAIAMLMWMEES